MNYEKLLLRRPEVEALTGLKRSSLYQLIAEDKFPKPVKLTERSVAWVASDVRGWIDERISSLKPCLPLKGKGGESYEL